MNFIKTYIIISVLFFSSLLYSQVRFAGNTYNIIAADKNTEKTYFENWTDFDFIYKKFQIGLRFEAHKPPLPYSLDTTGYGISQRYLNYFSDNFQVTVGNFYTMLGRGLVLRSFENRGIRWDTNIDGINLNFQTTYINGKIISGKPRDRSGLRLTRLDGGEITFKPFDLFHIGSTYLNTKNDDNKSLQRGSVYTNFNLPFLSLYAEYAGRQDTDLDWETGMPCIFLVTYLLIRLLYVLNIKIMKIITFIKIVFMIIIILQQSFVNIYTHCLTDINI